MFSEDFLPSSRGRISAHSQSKIATFSPNTMSDCFSQIKKSKKVRKRGSSVVRHLPLVLEVPG